MMGDSPKSDDLWTRMTAPYVKVILPLPAPLPPAGFWVTPETAARYAAAAAELDMHAGEQ